MIKDRIDHKKQLKRLVEYEDQLRKYEAELKRDDDSCRVHMINPSRICPNPDQPRRQFDADELSALAESIKRHGMIQPLTVRRLSDEDTPFGGLYELIAGERRLRAARMLELPYVPCLIFDADREESAKLALIENLQRKQLGYFEEAEAIDSLIRKYGVKQQEAAELLSVSQSYFLKIYRACFGTSCAHDIQHSKLAYAKKLLLQTDMILQDIAERCGYDYSHFMRLFKKEVGMTPTAYRKGASR